MLTYPLEAGGIDSDYVIFTPEEYRSNAPARQGSTTRGGTSFSPPSRGTGSIVLYMPNSTPSVGNGQNWGSSGDMFVGPRGAFMRDLSGDAAKAYSQGMSPEALVQGVVDGLSTTAKGGMDAAKQFALEGLTGIVGVQANAALAVEKGVVFNPNIELLYSAPGLRSFQFQYNFIPKSAQEAAAVNNIIRQFKMHSSPEKNGFMYKVPDVFQVTYMSGSGPNRSMNRFKKAALKGITVQANGQSAMHVAHEGGVPVETSLTLSFMEVDVITREDHNSVGGQGF